MAIYAQPGASHTFTLRDLAVNGTPVTTDTPNTTVMVFLRDINGVVVTTPLAAIPVGDDWSATVVLSVLAGSYVVVAAVTIDGTTTEFDEPVVIRLAPPPGATTRKGLRRRIADAMGDLRRITATATEGGNTTFTDATNLRDEPGTYTGREVILTSGTVENLGQVRAVATSSRENNRLTFSLGLPVPVAIGDEADMVNERAVGWRAAEYHRAINAAIEDAAESTHVPMSATLTAFNRYTGTLDLPASMILLNDVQYQDRLGGWHSIIRANRPDGDGWYVPRGTGTVRIGNWSATNAHGSIIRVHGSGIPEPLDDDEDVTTVDAEWLTARSAYQLLVAGIHRTGGAGEGRERAAALYLDQSERLRRRIARRAGANATAVW